MKIQEVTRLLDAGFTKDEILALVPDLAASAEQGQEHNQEQNQEQAQNQNQEQNQEQAQNQNQEQNQEQGQEQPTDETEKRLSSIEESIKFLTKTIQKQNLLNDRINSNDETLEQQTDAIMKSIIRPEQKERMNK